MAADLGVGLFRPSVAQFDFRGGLIWVSSQEPGRHYSFPVLDFLTAVPPLALTGDSELGSARA